MSQYDAHVVGQLVNSLATSLPWLSFLPEKDRERFATESAEALGTTIEAWRNTVVNGMALSAQLSRAIDHHAGNVEAALSELFTWTSELSASALTSYAVEIQPLVCADAGLETFRELLRTQVEWRETAAAYAAGLRPG